MISAPPTGEELSNGGNSAFELTAGTSGVPGIVAGEVVFEAEEEFEVVAAAEECA